MQPIDRFAEETGNVRQDGTIPITFDLEKQGSSSGQKFAKGTRQHLHHIKTESSGSQSKVFIVDDDEAARESVCALLAAMEVPVEAFESAEDFLASYDGGQAGCLVTDLRMHGISGLELQQYLNRAKVRLPVIIISAFVDVETAVTAMKEGAVTVLTKPYTEQLLWDAIQRGLKLCAAWRSEESRQVEIKKRFAELSAGELEVLELISEGTPNKVVATRLDVSIRTVETRRARIMKKLGVDSFASLLHLIHELPEEDN